MRFLFFVIFLALFIQLKAQEKTLLYKINRSDLPQPSYIFGTMHMIPKKDYFFTDSMKLSLERCSTLVLEIDLSEISLKDQISMSRKAFLPRGLSLELLMGKSAYAQFKKTLIDSLGIKERKIDRVYNRIKPFYLSGLLFKEYIGKSKEYERELTKKAKRKNMTIDQLETVDFQMSLVENMSLKEQVDQFLDVSEFSSYRIMLDLYKNQNLDGLLAFSMQDISQNGEEDTFMRDFVKNRNLTWISKITNFAQKKPTFVAVGALHLPGEYGVLELLRKQGFTVSPVY